MMVKWTAGATHHPRGDKSGYLPPRQGALSGGQVSYGIAMNQVEIWLSILVHNYSNEGTFSRWMTCATRFSPSRVLQSNDGQTHQVDVHGHHLIMGRSTPQCTSA
jgi:hypothetical protein